jgi:hypothetical protein
MKRLIYFIVISATIFSCQPSVKQAAILMDLDETNQEQFTFLVFDKMKVDTFMSKFDPLNGSNSLIKEELLKLKARQFESTNNQVDRSFKTNTKEPDTSDWNIAMEVINAAYDKDGEKHFTSCLGYLFFYKCLPDRFQNKWTQTISGDFRFNVVFFALLRDKSQVIDKMIYSEMGYYDEKLQPVFGEHIFNEITSDRAKEIKEIILNDKSFDDIMFKTDRDNFIYFLDKTISGEWRLILTDWN